MDILAVSKNCAVDGRCRQKHRSICLYTDIEVLHTEDDEPVQTVPVDEQESQENKGRL